MSDHLLVAIGQNLKAIRLRRNLSQESLASLADLDRTYISGVERGKRNVSIINLFKIAQALNVKASELIDIGVAHD
ncbi:helix-turn-helix transcriptional regulator [Gilvimarinus sp. SDUM040013]|uniref:Helix-turn-helix transcriptional regulator n=1 Tax=Gilvimarinus gilvus TaxID=3058038 RepID=A0ABU4RUH9_9GAMM|nr:helix-turn-helix transcriptional regulator [Gilvimarinus sp. SDUM040013]MDO3388593.1 helix-turn-helix transcriptional regulator [Gilvimarinus sp. SDUM040013]MDX6848535.1 helix-turn-helix transcriptional regulator [Gilvimarinus sp. SDUM040013]